MAARKPRQRYRIKSNVYANGVSLEGVTCLYMGKGNSQGKKSPNKGDNLWHHLRVEDPKALKSLGLTPALWRDRFVLDQHLKSFYDGPL